jgi:membrane-bound lytic murein transglycosylase D
MTLKIIKALTCLTLITTLTACDANLVNTQTAITPAVTQHHYHYSIWKNLSSHFAFKKDYTQPLVQQQIHFIKKNPHYLTSLTESAKPYIYYIFEQLKKRHMPAEIACLPMIESAYNPFLYSHQGATGIWQMMPGTASGLGLKIDWWYDSRRDIIDSTNAALDYLSYLHRFFNNWQLAIAAYNAGEGTVQDAIDFNKEQGKPTDFWHLSLPAETKTYLPKLLAITAMMSDSPFAKKHLSPVSNRPYLKAVTIDKQYNLSVLANLSDISEQSLRDLNPGFRRFSTGPGDHRRFLIPLEKYSTFEHNLSTYTGRIVTWRHHLVENGENLSSLAKQYQTTINIIKEVNHLSNDQLQLGQVLLIPESITHHAPDRNTTNEVIAEDNLPGPTRILYLVERQDTLSSIATRFNVKAREIRYWNQLHSSRLSIGQALIIWKKHTTFKPNYFIHTVRRGENLITIAKRFNVDVKQVREENNLKRNQIKINQKLHIPYHQASHYTPQFHNQLVIHHVKPGDSISSLAHYYRVPQKEIINLNHLHKGEYLHLGQPIKIYFSS